MPFEVWTGTMGGGKSYAAAEKALEYWRKGRIVMSNMAFRPEVIKLLDGGKGEQYWANHIEIPKDPADWLAAFVGGAEDEENLLIIDEASFLFHTWDAAESKKRDRDLYDVLVMSRKIGIHSMFISQSGSNLNSALRRIALYEKRCTATKRVPIFGPIAARLWGGFIRDTRTPDGSKKLWREYVRFKKEVGSIYKTEDVTGVAATIKRGKGTADNGTKERFKTPLWVKLGMGMILIVFSFGVRGVYNMYQNTVHKDELNKKKIAQIREDAGKPKTVGEKIGDASKEAFIGTQEPVPPRFHPFGEPSGIKSTWFEWDESDERIICGELAGVLGKSTKRTYTMGGEVWYVGATIQGDVIASIVDLNKQRYVTMESKRTYLLRWMTYKERRELDEFNQRMALRKQLANQQTGVTIR